MRGVLEEARSRGLREVWLEVLFPNEPAIRLYEKLGFERVRVLEVWTLDGVDFRGDGALPSPSSRRRNGSGANGASVSRGSGRTSRSRTWRTSRRSRATAAHCSTVAQTTESHCCRPWPTTNTPHATCCRASRPEAKSLQWLNGPAGDPFNAAIESLGGTLAWRQHEMLLRLA